ncbi:hypothetical protein LR48_Vigan01g156200 [Vigna angularis]|uniref:Uncharacterized protein n=1 Tax=Phaseolus angularis TaxID=3914 RepID=A0A0L9TNH8_PHAAN|nr:hypothetical protein LR48_Vigan01g156200 [Vigna angularis]
MHDSRDHSPSPASDDSPPNFNSIVMMSLPDSSDPVPQGVFHTSPEAVTDGGDPYAFNHAADVDAGMQGELSHSEEPSAKKSKLSDVDLDLDSSEGCVEVPSLKGEEDKGNCEGNLVSEAEKASDCSAKILETVVGNSSEEMNVFDVYRVFLEMNNEKEKNLDNLDLLEVAEACGVTFPRPRWWPENFDP